MSPKSKRSCCHGVHVDEQALQLLTKSGLSEGHLCCLFAVLEFGEAQSAALSIPSRCTCMSDNAAAGDPEEDLCIDSSDAIMLDDLVKENGVEGSCWRTYTEKCKQPNFKMWPVPAQQQRNSDPVHCPELFYDNKEVLPTHQWLPAVQQAYAEYEAQASSTKQKPIAEKVKAVMDLLGKRICVRGKQFGISKKYIAAYIQQCQQHVDTQHALCQTCHTQNQKVTYFSSQKAAVQRPS